MTQLYLCLFRLWRRVGFGLEVEVLQGLDGVVGVAPAARRVVKALVGEEVLIGGVEVGATGVVQVIGVDLTPGCVICGLIGWSIIYRCNSMKC